MNEEEKQAIEDLKNIVTDLEDTEDGAIISLQQEEIDSLKILAELMVNQLHNQQEKIENSISIDKIKKTIGIEEDIEERLGKYDEEKLLNLLQIIVDENNRLEDIEDRKVMVAADNIEKQRDKYWKNKIKAKIKELDDIDSSVIAKMNREECKRLDFAIEKLLELLEE